MYDKYNTIYIYIYIQYMYILYIMYILPEYYISCSQILMELN